MIHTHNIPFNFICQYEGSHSDTFVFQHTGVLFIPKGECAIALYQPHKGFSNILPDPQLSLFIIMAAVSLIAGLIASKK